MPVQPETKPVDQADDEDVPARQRPFHTHPFLTAGGKVGHAHAGAELPHNHNYEVNPYDGVRYADMTDYLTFVRRVIAGLANRVGEADLEALGAMAQLRDELDGAMLGAISGLRHDDDSPASWTDIGTALGVTRQAAQKRYGMVGGRRSVGGQRSDWR